MNKRQLKKRNKIINHRIEHLNRTMLFTGRRNGKTLLRNRMVKAIYSKRYKFFNELKKELEHHNRNF